MPIKCPELVYFHPMFLKQHQDILKFAKSLWQEQDLLTASEALKLSLSTMFQTNFANEFY